MQCIFLTEILLELLLEISAVLLYFMIKMIFQWLIEPTSLC